MESFSQTGFNRREGRLPDVDLLIVRRTIKVKILVQCTILGIAENTGNLRKAWFTFWKLAAPNLIPGLVQLPANGRKLFVDSTLDKMAALSFDLRAKPRFGVCAGKDRRSAQFRLTRR
jgi:hypothetical protein